MHYWLSGPLLSDPTLPPLVSTYYLLCFRHNSLFLSLHHVMPVPRPGVLYSQILLSI